MEGEGIQRPDDLRGGGGFGATGIAGDESGHRLGALSARSASDLEKTPYLHWDWRIDKSIAGFDERTKEGDDYSARIYVVRSHPIFRWKTRAVNYVWAGSQDQGETWPSAYTDASHNVALRSGDTQAGQWVSEWRDVRADFQSLLGENARSVDGVAIMTDTDNTGSEAVGWYRNVFFSSEPGEAGRE